MRHFNLHAISSCQPLGHALGEVHGTVLPSRAAEDDLKVLAAVFEIFVDRLADERFRRSEEAIHLVFVVVKEIGNGLVAARIPSQRFIPVRIRHRPAVEYEATAVAGFVLRQTALVREGCDCNFHRFATFPFRLLTIVLSSVSTEARRSYVYLPFSLKRK